MNRSSVPLNAEILAKKLWGRMLDSHALLARDLYDFAVARHHDPGAVKAAMTDIDVSDLQQLKRELENLPENWMRRTDTRPLIRSAYPEEASNPAPFVRAQVWGEILSRTPPRPHRSPRNSARASLVSWRGVTPASRASANTAL